MWQVQFGMDDDNRFATNLILDALVSLDNDSNDWFTLSPLRIFILLFFQIKLVVKLGRFNGQKIQGIKLL